VIFSLELVIFSLELVFLATSASDWITSTSGLLRCMIGCDHYSQRHKPL
jgi:hypothetical protein